MPFWHAQTDALYSFLKADGKFMAMLRSENFTREQLEKEYNKLLRRYLRQTEDTKVKKLIDKNKEMFLEEFKVILEQVVDSKFHSSPHQYYSSSYDSISIPAEP